MKLPSTVLRADILGFCSGVRIAVETAEKLAREHPGEKIYSSGNLVHNRHVIRKLAEIGVHPMGSISDAEPGIAILRAHGETPEAIQSLKDRGFTIVDATCAKVRRSHKLIAEYSHRGYHIVIAGERDHSEVRGLVARADSVSVIESVAEVETDRGHSPALLIAQTTFSPGEFERIAEHLVERYKDLHVIRTICPAMEKRHKSLEDLAQKVDAVLIVGGKSSANTRRLFERAQSTGIPAWHIEEASEIPAEVYQFARVGITAGASTPAWIIDGIEERLKGKPCG